MKVDCNITENYIKEKARMTKSCTGCNTCPLAFNKNDRHIPCGAYEDLYTDKAIAIVQEWSDKHQIETRAERYFKLFPNAISDDGGNPLVCYKILNYESQGRECCSKNCSECWQMACKESK